MIKVQETTFANGQYNHTYFLSNDKFLCHGYIPFNTVLPVMFKSPLKFSSKGRTFKKLKER